MEIDLHPFTVVLETTEPFGPEVQIMHEEATDGREAALRALHHWHTLEYTPTTTIADLEDDSARVMAVFEGHTTPVLTRTPAQQLA